MARIGNIRRLNFKKIIYGKGLDELLPIAMKNPQPEYNILNQIAVYMQSKIKDGELNYYLNSITMDSDSGAIGIDNRYTACIFHTTEEFFENWLTPRAVSKCLEEPYHHSSRKESYSGNGKMT